MRDIDKIQRQVHFINAQVFDPEDTSGKNNTWKYNRAIEGYKFILVSAHISTCKRNTLETGIVAFYDGHEYTHWNQFPGVESRELLARCETNIYTTNVSLDLHNWECKEYTIGARSITESFAYKVCVIVYYYLEKMSSLETLYYAVIQPRWKRFKKAFRTTLSRFEG